MKKIVKRMGITIGIATAVSSLAFAQATKAPNLNRMQDQINNLQTQLNKARQKTGIKVDKKTGKRTCKRTRKFFHNYVVIAPYTGRPTYNTGTTLIVNAPSINEDAKLLERRYLEEKAMMDQHVPLPHHPRLVLSGKVEGKMIYTRPYVGSRSSDIDLSGAELDAFAELSHWVNGSMGITYDNKVGATSRRIDNSNLHLDKGFLTIGNYWESPFYGSVGQMYVPFGRYSSNMIADPLTKFVGKTKARAISVGYMPNKDIAPYAHVFFFKGDSFYGGSNFARQYGADVGFHVLRPKYSWNAGVSYINNIAESGGMQDNGRAAGFRGFDQSRNEHLVHRVGGADVHGSVGYRKFTLIGEYVTALQQFAPSNLTYNSHGAKPRAGNVELSYLFIGLKKPMSIGLDYGRSAQALGLNIAQQRYGAVWAVSLMDSVTAKLEYYHDINYAKSVTATGQNLGATTVANQGRTNDTVTAELGVYF